MIKNVNHFFSDLRTIWSVKCIVFIQHFKDYFRTEANQVPGTVLEIQRQLNQLRRALVPTSLQTCRQICITKGYRGYDKYSHQGRSTKEQSISLEREVILEKVSLEVMTKSQSLKMNSKTGTWVIPRTECSMNTKIEKHEKEQTIQRSANNSI